MLNRAFWLALIALPLTAQPTEPSERAIRVTLHDLTVASIKGDVKTVRLLSTQRSLGLYDVLFGILTEAPAAKAQLAKLGVKNGAEFFENSLKTAARAAAAQKIDAEPLARKNAETATIEFRSVTDALVQVPSGNSWRALREGDAWKLDSVDSARKNLLQSPLLQGASAVQRQRLEDY